MICNVLGLKFLISKKFGEVPKTHSLRILFELAELEHFYRGNLDVLREIELAYTALRYFDVEYSKEIAEKSIQMEYLHKFVQVQRLEV